MSHLLDVSFLLACGWDSHPRHKACRAWLERQPEFYTCPITELGFIRVSMTPAFRTAFDDAKAALENITNRKGARFLPEDLDTRGLSGLVSHGEVTDGYLVALSKKNGLKLATLDESLCRKAWAKGLAENPV